ncbi:cell division protein FtsQ/DivIB [Uliginosibacterium sp. 31-16]|uniref:cell division protein FtsQ/DivIB n=1 Tax=Uliginosibacterium sp. 31-16 TaxID=3068315 RepID=UPI00273E118D|nr:cell division protein FtsQ/DivIB [Uliginosibacterium sp. 31-16]MDP5237941.1 cell division protein FtsQ/DivIB [Uliginosibacterium sp. 31-16]
MTEHQPAFGKTTGARGREASARQADGGFWHRPDWMNLVSGVLILLASVMFGIVAFKVVVKMPLFALREVVVISPLGHVTHAQLRYVAASSLRGNFFTVDLDRARKAFENLPWVRNAQLRRLWPGSIEVVLEEHVAVAYWRSVDSGDTRLVNSFGELFDAAANDSMPVFSGPSDSSAQILAEMRQLNEVLQPMQRKIVALSLSGRHAWQLKLDDGMVIELGKDLSKDQDDRKVKATPEERLARFVALWPQTREKLGRPVLVADLRYQSGFALRMANSEQGKGK